MLPVCSGLAVKFWCAGVPVPGRLTRRIFPRQVDLTDLPGAGLPRKVVPSLAGWTRLGGQL